MSDYKTILGFVAVSIVVLSFFPYIRHVLKGQTKPHAFSWFIWTLLTGTGAAAQLTAGAGAGAWPWIANSILCAAVFVLAIKRGEKNFTKLDWFVLILALLALFLWSLTGNPLIAVVLVTIADCIAYIPTFRKSYHKPSEETLSIYLASSLFQTISIFALESYSLTTWLYPATVLIVNIVFVATVAIRRIQVTRS